MSKVLVISPVPTHPQDEGCNQRVYTLVHELRKLGHDVNLLHIARHQGDVSAMSRAWKERLHCIEYRDPMNYFRKLMIRIRGKLSLPYNYRIDDWCYEGLKSEVKKVIDRVEPDVVIVEYIYLSCLFTLVPQAKLKILDTHDVMSGRHEKIIAAGHTPRWFSCTPEEEAKALDRADVIVAIQDIERDFFSRLTTKKVVTVGHLVPHRQPEKPSLNGRTLLFVGTGNPPNVDAITWFIKKILPRLVVKLPGIKLILVGKICNQIQDFPHCLKYGRVEDLSAVYQSVDVVLNPVRFGTGLKIKSIEALGYAKPLVTTPVGAEGMEFVAGEAFLLANDENEFEEYVYRLLTDKHLYERVCAGAYQFVLKWNEQHLSAVSQLISDVTVERQKVLQ